MKYECIMYNEGKVVIQWIK